MNRPHTLHEITRVNGLIARSVIESNNTDFIRCVHELRTICDIAIQHHTFRVMDLAEEVDDDEL